MATIRLVLMADACGLDLDEIVLDKIEKNNQKYPVEKAYGSKQKYTELKKYHPDRKIRIKAKEMIQHGAVCVGRSAFEFPGR